MPPKTIERIKREVLTHIQSSFKRWVKASATEGEKLFSIWAEDHTDSDMEMSDAFYSGYMAGQANERRANKKQAKANAER